MAAEHTIQIRNYQPDDRDELIALVRELQSHELQFFDRMKQPQDIGPWYVEELQRQCRKSAGEILVLDCAGRIGGYATILTAVEQDECDEVRYTYALVGDIAVSGDLRCQGLGRRLLEECEDRARKAGARWLRICALDGNAHALNVYRKFGFDDHLIELEKAID